jgi:CHASE1-domain containing sensor protein
MDRARDTALPAATRRVRLVQEIDPEDEQMGFLIYVPVYRHGGVPDTIEKRRAQLLGFVYSPFRAGDLLGAVQRALDPGEVMFDVFDGLPQEGRWLYRSSSSETLPPRFETQLAAEVAGRTWTLVVHSGRVFSATSARTIAALVAAIGILLSALLFSVTTTLVNARHAAERRAEESRRSEEALRDANKAKDEFLAIV